MAIGPVGPKDPLDISDYDTLDDQVYGRIQDRACAWCGATHFHTVEDMSVKEERRRSCDIRRLPFYLYFRRHVSLWACITYPDLVNKLLSESCTPHLVYGGRTLLRHALQQNAPVEVIRQLLEYGARFDRCGDSVTSPSHDLSRTPFRLFYEAPSLLQWVDYKNLSLTPLVAAGIIEGTNDESMVLPAYFEKLILSPAHSRDVETVAEDIALMLRYTCTFIDTYIYPPARQELHTDPDRLRDCPWKIGDLVLFRHTDANGMVTVPDEDTSTVVGVTDVYPGDTRTLQGAFVSDRGIGSRGQVCVRLHGTPLYGTGDHHWVDAHSLEIFRHVSRSNPYGDVKTWTLYRYLNETPTRRQVLDRVRTHVHDYTRFILQCLLESTTDFPLVLIHLVCTYLCSADPSPDTSSSSSSLTALVSSFSCPFRPLSSSS